MATIRERFEALRTEAAAEIARLEREAQEARDVLALLGGAAPTEAQAEAAREYNAEAAHAFGKRAYHGRNLRARALVLEALSSGPKTIRDIASAVYGASGSHEADKAERVVGHMAKAGQVTVANGRVTVANGRAPQRRAA